MPSDEEPPDSSTGCPGQRLQGTSTPVQKALEGFQGRKSDSGSPLGEGRFWGSSGRNCTLFLSYMNIFWGFLLELVAEV